MRLSSWLGRLFSSLSVRPRKKTTGELRRRLPRDVGPILELLEDRALLAATVQTTSFLDSGTLATGVTQITVTFSEPVLGADQAANYELRQAGADGLMLASDTAVNPSNVSVSGNTATLTFSELTEDVYRLTVKDTITDASSNALDGDGDGTAGVDWRRDFVVGALTTALPYPNGFTFDPEFGGIGAGQLVQGTNNAFDGLGRLKVGSTDFIGGVPSPLLLTTAMSSNSTATLTGSATVPFNQLVSTTTGAPAANVSTSEQTVGTNGEYSIAARVTLQSVTSNRAVVLSIVKNGAVVSSKIHQLVNLGIFPYDTVDISDRLTLVAGDKISIKLDTLGANSTLFSGSSYGAFFHVSKIADILGSGSAVPTTAMSSNSTATLTGSATVPFNQLVSTTTGAPAANVSTSEQTVGTNGEYSIAARVTLQSVTSNRAVVLSIVKNGAVVSSKIHQLVNLGIFPYDTVDISDRLTLVAGDKISIKLDTLGANSTLFSGSSYGAFFHVSKIADILGSGSAVPTTAMSSNSTATLTGSATVPFNQLVSTTTGAPAANVSTSEQTVGTNGEYSIAARVTLQSVTSNRAVVLSIVKNGAVVSSKIHQLVNLGIFPYDTVDISDRLTLVAGDKISIKLDTLGANSTLFSGSSYGAFFHVSKIADIPNATFVNTGRTIRTDSQTVASLTVSREVNVPASGPHDFSRTVDTFTNSTDSSITAPVRVVGNLGSDANTVVFATSDGDTIVETTDWWFGADDADGTGTPAVIHLLHGPAGLIPTNVAVTNDNVEWTYNLTVDAGQTKRLAYFAVLGSTRAAAIAAANTLVTTSGFGGQAAAFLSQAELDSLANFQFTPEVNVSVSANSGTEAGTTQITLTATAAHAVTGNQTVDVAVTGTGITSGDYALSNATITILDGQTSGSVTFTVSDDLLVEASETATLTISNPSSGIALGTTTSQNVTITDNDAADSATITQPTNGTADSVKLVINSGNLEVRTVPGNVLLSSRSLSSLGNGCHHPRGER